MSANLPEPDQAAKRRSLAVQERLHEEIAQGGGFLGFERFMELALYAPGLGYYMQAASPLVPSTPQKPAPPEADYGSNVGGDTGGDTSADGGAHARGETGNGESSLGGAAIGGIVAGIAAVTLAIFSGTVPRCPVHRAASVGARFERARRCSVRHAQRDLTAPRSGVLQCHGGPSGLEVLVRASRGGATRRWRPSHSQLYPAD